MSRATAGVRILRWQPSRLHLYGGGRLMIGFVVAL